MGGSDLCRLGPYLDEIHILRKTDRLFVFYFRLQISAEKLYQAMAITNNIPVSEILRSKASSEDEPKKKSREDWRKAKELEEARKVKKLTFSSL